MEEQKRKKTNEKRILCKFNLIYECCIAQANHYYEPVLKL